MSSSRTDLIRRATIAMVLGAALVVGMSASASAKPKVKVPTECSFSGATGQTTCVTIAAEVFDHYETPTLPDTPCTDTNGDPSTQTQGRRDSVYRTDTTTQIYQGKGVKPPSLISTQTTSSYRTQIGSVDLGPCSDVTAPDTSILTGPSSSTTATAATFTFTANEPGSAYECRLDGAEFETCTSPTELSGLALGFHWFQVRATDGTGNVDATPAAWYWSVVVPPSVTITQSPAEVTNSPLASFTFTATPGASLACQLDDEAFSQCLSPRQYYGLEVGEHTFTVRATNANGSSTDTRSWTIEANLPICAAEITSFTQLPSGLFEVAGSGLGCATYVQHTRSPIAFPCTGGGVGFDRNSIYLRSWTETGVVFDDSVAAGQWSMCVTLYGEFNGLEGSDALRFDYADFMAGPDPMNVSLQGVSTDGLTFTGTVVGAAIPSLFADATVIANFSHDPVQSPFGCVKATGTWSYANADGTLVHFTPHSWGGSYCPSETGGSYWGSALAVPTSDDLLASSASNLSFRFEYHAATHTFTGYQYGRFPYVVR